MLDLRLATVTWLSLAALTSCNGEEVAPSPTAGCPTATATDTATAALTEEAAPAAAATSTEGCPKPEVVSEVQPNATPSGPEDVVSVDSALPPGPTPPTPAPGAFAIIATGNTSQPRPTFSWGVSEHAASYNVSIGTNSTCTAAPFSFMGVTSTSVAIPASAALLNLTNYFVCVSAVNAGGSTAATNNGLAHATSFAFGSFTISSPSGDIGDTTPQITWTAETGATSYDVSVSTAANCSDPVRTFPARAGTTMTVADDEAFSYADYYVCVNAIDAAGLATVASNNGRAFSIKPPPAAFAIAGGNSTSNPRPTFSWDVAAGALRYDVKIATNAACTTPQFTFDDVATTSVSIPSGSSLANLTYYVCVTAENDFGSTIASNNGFAHITNFPTGTFAIIAPDYEIATTTPTVSWATEGGAVSYNLIISSTSNCLVAVRSYYGETNPAVTVAAPDALPFGDYYSCVYAIDASGNAKSATNNGLFFSISSLGSFQIWGMGTSQITTPWIDWQDSTGVDHYDVSVHATQDCTSTALASVSQPGTSFSVPAGSALGQGTFYVCASAVGVGAGNIRYADNSPLTFDVDATPSSFSIVPFVNNLTNDTTPTFGWTSADYATSYTAKVSTASDCSTTVAMQTEVTSQSWTVPNGSALSAGVTYYLCVTAQGENNTSRPADANTTFSINTTPPLAGGGLSATPTGANWSGLQLTWTPGSDDTTVAANLWYEMYYSTNNDIQTVAATLANGTLAGRVRNTNHGLLTGPASTMLYVNVLIVDQAGNRTAYNSVSGTTATGTIAAVGWDASADNILTTGDDQHQEYTLPFPFPYFGRTIEKIGVSTNGQIVLLENGESCGFSCSTYNAYANDTHHASSLDTIYTFDGDNVSNATLRMQADRVYINFTSSTFGEQDFAAAQNLFRITLFNDGRVQWHFYKLNFALASSRFTGVFNAVGDAMYEIPGGSATVLASGASQLAFEFDPTTPIVNVLAWDANEKALAYNDGHIEYPLPFTFPFRGRSITKISVNPHGLAELLENAESCTICDGANAYGLGNLAGVDALLLNSETLQANVHFLRRANQVEVLWSGGRFHATNNTWGQGMIMSLTLKNDGDIVWKFHDSDQPFEALPTHYFTGMYDGVLNGPMEIPGGSAISGWPANQAFVYDHP